MSRGDRTARKTRVLFIRPSKASFIEQDLKLLEKHYDVRTLDVFEKGRSLGNKVSVFWRMFRGVLWADVTYSWFAEVYALWAVRLSRLLGKQSVVVIGGYEVAQVPEISYGSALHPETREMVAKILSKAGKSIAVSEFVKRSARTIAPDADIDVVYNAVDVDALVPSEPKMEIVVTVGGATRPRWVLKGIDIFVSASTKVPGAKFVVIGPFDQQVVDGLQKMNQAVEFTGELSRERLIEWLDKAKVYCQLSRVESFGFALAEAMSLECYPVVSDQGALPEVVGESGLIVPYGDPIAAAEAIKKGLRWVNGHDARTRIAERFSVDRREKDLCRVIDSLVSR
ncbi:MAG: hypothetical protein A3K76_05720 [Euryarchaeota archaeon RBG_13_57_23]|nr:MAG: hypothetical protein A3K76_05720 [Euryarchaeota archaeon RBG_13_57_23]